jgi:hypothetical protein
MNGFGIVPIATMNPAKPVILRGSRAKHARLRLRMAV